MVIPAELPLLFVIPDLIRDDELQAASFAALDAGSSPA
jgi:hypothetical protein